MVNPKQLLLFYLLAALKRFELYLLLFCAIIVIAARQTPEKEVSQAEEVTVDPVVLSKTDSVLLFAESLLGVPYRFAGKKPSGFDCSGFTRYVYQQVGHPIAASARHQFLEGVSVTTAESQPGDLVFFTSRSKVNHVGIVSHREAGKTYFIHASTSRGVVTDCLDMPYFQKRLAGVRRVMPS
uniref:C40 family peptidase n=1 Tax=Roseihalotalea indica TaxID=2867963 RepID=A0AA49JC68_9BACT|nr:C40 family peptidase [Tunicatimonas sp. TK19036]